MLQRLTTQLPEWARPEHPAIRHVLGAPTQQSRRALILQLICGVVLLLGTGFATSGIIGQNVALPLSEILINALFYPTFVGQILVSLLIIIYTSGIVSTEKRRQTWDTLRTTRNGINLMLRARWSAAIFYRMSGLILALYIVRVILVLALVYDLTAFSGEYLGLLSGAGVVPQLPLPVVIMLLALSMSASFILPLTGWGLDAAVGLLLSTFIHQRVFLVLAQVIVGLARFAVAVAAFALLLYTTDIVTMPSAISALGSMVAYAALGDWGLRYLHLSYYGELWAMVPFGIFAGAGMLVAAFMQALLADGLVWLAVRRGEGRE